MSTIIWSPMVPSATTRYFMFLFKITRLAFVYAFIMLAILLFMLHGFNNVVLPNTRIFAKNFTNQSPLQKLLAKELISKENILPEEYRENDFEILRNINDQSSLELRKIVIAEIVVPFQDRDKLVDFVSKQIEASDTLSYLQTSAIMNMINLNPTQASISKDERGQSGTLRNCVVLAAIKRDMNNIHFILIGIRAEPHLGWRWINASQRNSWNNVLSRLLTTKVRLEAENYLLQDIDVGDAPFITQAKVEGQLALEQLLHKSFST